MASLFPLLLIPLLFPSPTLKVRVRGIVHRCVLRRHRSHGLPDGLRARERHWLVHVRGRCPATCGRVIVLAPIDLGHHRTGHRSVTGRLDDSFLDRPFWLVEGNRGRGNRFLEIFIQLLEGVGNVTEAKETTGNRYKGTE